MFVFQVVLVYEEKPREFYKRFGIYSSLENAKEAAELNFLDEFGELEIDECYIEMVNLDEMPEKWKRQGKKICYINDYGCWEPYK
jgi:hypothetical protein